MRLETALIHAGEQHPRIEGAIAMPVFQSSTFEFEGGGDYLDVRYIRLNNTPQPHRLARQARRCLESAESALVTASGMAAISSTFLYLAFAGRSPPRAPHDLWRHARDLVTKDLPCLGIDHTFVDADDPGELGEGDPPHHARLLRRDHDQPAARGGGPPRRRSPSPRTRARLGHRQHVRVARELPPRHARLRPRRPQRDQVPERALGPRRGRGRRQGRARAGRQAQARSPGRLARSACVLPPAPRHQDPRPLASATSARPRSRSPGSSRATRPCPTCTTRVSRAIRDTAAPGSCSPGSAGCSASSCAADWQSRSGFIARLQIPGERAEPRRRGDARDPPCHDVPRRPLARGTRQPRHRRWAPSASSVGLAGGPKTSSRTWIGRSPGQLIPPSSLDGSAPSDHACPQCCSDFGVAALSALCLRVRRCRLLLFERLGGSPAASLHPGTPAARSCRCRPAPPRST